MSELNISSIKLMRGTTCDEPLLEDGELYIDKTLNKMIMNSDGVDVFVNKQQVDDLSTYKGKMSSGSYNIGAQGAIGYGSHAEGSGTQAIGGYSHTEGGTTVANGLQSHAEGRTTIANGEGSHADGSGTEAIGAVSHAEGFFTKTGVFANFSHAEGANTQTIGQGSHAEGHNTLAVAFYSHAEGSGTESIGGYSHTEGFFTKTREFATFSHAEGQLTEAIGVSSHAEGQDTRAEGAASHAEGLGTIALGNNQHVSGFYNVSDSSSSLIVGKGTSSSVRSNSFRIDSGGTVYTASGTVSAGADYAEYFESASGEAIPNGTKVQLNGNKIEVCTDSNNAIGVISARPAILGDSEEDCGVSWKDKFVKDVWGNYVTEEIIIDYTEFEEYTEIVDDNEVKKIRNVRIKRKTAQLNLC